MGVASNEITNLKLLKTEALISRMAVNFRPKGGLLKQRQRLWIKIVNTGCKKTFQSEM